MSSHVKPFSLIESVIVEVKSKFDAEFRRFSVLRTKQADFRCFYSLLEKLHGLYDVMFVVTYSSREGDQLPINNDENLTFALTSTKSLLRLLLQRKGESSLELTGYGSRPATSQRSGFICHFFQTKCNSAVSPSEAVPAVGPPCNFHHISSIIDVDIVPPSQRRVKMMSPYGDNRPLGFYIRDGHGTGIFVSRLVPGGVAAGTGLLAVGDEIVEVNGIDVVGKTLDQVTDMMIANSSNLLLTICPVNQCNNVVSKSRQMAPPRVNVRHQHLNDVIDNDNCTAAEDDTDDDEVCDHMKTRLPVAATPSGVPRSNSVLRRQSLSNNKTMSKGRERRVLRV